MEFLKALPYVVGILATVGAGIKWLYGQIKEDRNHYEKLYQQKQAEVEELKDQLNEKEIEIVKLRASQKDAFLMGRKMIVKRLKQELTKLNAKRTKLSKFLAKQNKKTLSATQRELLKEQKQVMAKYAKVLKLRIKDLEAKNDD